MHTIRIMRVLLFLILATVTFPLITSLRATEIDGRGIAQLTAHLHSVLRSVDENTLFSTNALQTGLTATRLATQKKTNTHTGINHISNVDGDDAEAAARVNKYLKFVNNRIFVNKNMELNKKRSDLFKADKRLRATEVIMGMNEKTVRVINKIVANETHKKIQNIFTTPASIDSDTGVIFLSITDYLFEWNCTFKDFGLDAFTNARQSTDVKFMYTEGNFKHNYIKEWDAFAVEIPIEDATKGTRLLLLKPNKLDGLERLKDKVYTQDFGKIQKLLKKKSRISVYIPQLKDRAESKIKKALIKLNMTAAFKTSAEFNQLLNEKEELYIKNFRHDAYVKFTTKGIEGSAVTSVQWEVTSAGGISALKRRPQKLKYFAKPTIVQQKKPETGPEIIQFNHPFIYAVLQKAVSKTRVWFIGTVQNVET